MKNVVVAVLLVLSMSLFAEPSSSGSAPSLSSPDWDTWALSIMDSASITTKQKRQLTPIFQSYDNALNQALNDSEESAKIVDRLSTDLVNERQKADVELFVWKLTVAGETALIIAAVVYATFRVLTK